MSVLKSFFKKLFCRHQYVKIGFSQEIDRGERYSLRRYRCQKCGKEIRVDGRRDPYWYEYTYRK